MRKAWTTWSALGFGWLLLIAPASAQQYGRSTEADEFRRYGSSANTSATSGSQGRPYQRSPVPKRRPPEQPVRTASRGVHDYFPGMRPGSGPNYNVPTPGRAGLPLYPRCVPGRHSLMSR